MDKDPTPRPLYRSLHAQVGLVGLVGRESDLFRFTLKHSIGLAMIVGIMTLSQAYWLTGMLVK